MIFLPEIWEPLREKYGRLITADMQGFGYSDKPVSILIKNNYKHFSHEFFKHFSHFTSIQIIFRKKQIIL